MGGGTGGTDDRDGAAGSETGAGQSAGDDQRRLDPDTADRAVEPSPAWDQAAGRDASAPAPAPIRRREPAFNLPSSLVWVLAVLLVIHAVRVFLLPEDLDAELVFTFAFLPARYAMSLAVQGFAWLWSPITYSFLHGSWEHVIFNAFWMVAFGAPVVRRIGTVRFALFWCCSAVAAVALHLLLHWGEIGVVIGASGVVSGLMGAAARFVFAPSGAIDRQRAHLNPRLSIGQALANRSVLFFTGIWFVMNLLVGLGLFAIAGADTVAWEAHIGGFLFGFLLFGLFDPQPRVSVDHP